MNTITIDHEWTETAEVDGAIQEVVRRIHLTVAGPANLQMGMRRTLYMEQQQASLELEESSEESTVKYMDDTERIAMLLLRLQLMPSMMAAVVKHEGFDKWPLTYAQFVDLPEELGIKWEEAVGKLNPHWRYEPTPETQAALEEKRKKVMDGISELLKE